MVQSVVICFPFCAIQGVLIAEFKGRTFHCGHSGAQAYGLDALGLFPELLPSTAKFDIIRYGADVVLNYHYACAATQCRQR
jgi:hypothetical protein